MKRTLAIFCALALMLTLTPAVNAAYEQSYLLNYDFSNPANSLSFSGAGYNTSVADGVITFVRNQNQDVTGDLLAPSSASQNFSFSYDIKIDSKMASDANGSDGRLINLHPQIYTANLTTGTYIWSLDSMAAPYYEEEDVTAEMDYCWKTTSADASVNKGELAAKFGEWFRVTYEIKDGHYLKTYVQKLGDNGSSKVLIGDFDTHNNLYVPNTEVYGLDKLIFESKMTAQQFQLDNIRVWNVPSEESFTVPASIMSGEDLEAAVSFTSSADRASVFVNDSLVDTIDGFGEYIVTVPEQKLPIGTNTVKMVTYGQDNAVISTTSKNVDVLAVDAGRLTNLRAWDAPEIFNLGKTASQKNFDTVTNVTAKESVTNIEFYVTSSHGTNIAFQPEIYVYNSNGSGSYDGNSYAHISFNDTLEHKVNVIINTLNNSVQVIVDDVLKETKNINFDCAGTQKIRLNYRQFADTSDGNDGILTLSKMGLKTHYPVNAPELASYSMFGGSISTDGDVPQSASSIVFTSNSAVLLTEGKTLLKNAAGAVITADIVATADSITVTPDGTLAPGKYFLETTLSTINGEKKAAEYFNITKAAAKIFTPVNGENILPKANPVRAFSPDADTLKLYADSALIGTDAEAANGIFELSYTPSKIGNTTLKFEFIKNNEVIETKEIKVVTDKVLNKVLESNANRTGLTGSSGSYNIETVAGKDGVNDGSATKYSSSDGAAFKGYIQSSSSVSKYNATDVFVIEHDIKFDAPEKISIDYEITSQTWDNSTSGYYPYPLGRKTFYTGGKITGTDISGGDLVFEKDKWYHTRIMFDMRNKKEYITISDDFGNMTTFSNGRDITKNGAYSSEEIMEDGRGIHYVRTQFNQGATDAGNGVTIDNYTFTNYFVAPSVSTVQYGDGIDVANSFIPAGTTSFKLNLKSDGFYNALTSENVELLSDGEKINAQFTYDKEAKTLNVVPEEALKAGYEYKIAVSGSAEVEGKAIVEKSAANMINVLATLYTAGETGIYVGEIDLDVDTDVAKATAKYINPTGGAKGAMLILAVYENDRLLSIKLPTIYEASSGEDALENEIPVPQNATKVVALVWESLNSLKPLRGEKSVDLAPLQ